ncbi:MAG: hypothetical protein FWF02_02645 [Micrococcales bacterium]|nr:hypothetical protein [Micrococcales bacterium]MCL2666587.1 hypothetical protein [Micrococcales bacterium]
MKKLTRVRRRCRRSRSRRGARSPTLLATGAALVAAAVGAWFFAARPNSVPAIDAVIVYTAPTAQDVAYSLPPSARQQLAEVAASGGTVWLVRVEGDGTASTTAVDLTPRTSKGELARVPAKVQADLADKTAMITAAMNTATPGTKARALYDGLLDAHLPRDVPVMVFSSLLDENTVDFRRLAWETDPAQLVQTLADAHALLDLTGHDVTFYLSATTGGQSLWPAADEYRQTVWAALAEAGGAESVRFVDGQPGPATSSEQVAVVPMWELPASAAPVVEPVGYSCTLATSSAFLPNSDVLVSEPEVRAALAECVALIGRSHVSATCSVAWFGPLGADGSPRDVGGVELSEHRAAAITSVITTMGVPADHISAKGAGNQEQPHPEDPTSPDNRVCVIKVDPTN